MAENSEFDVLTKEQIRGCFSVYGNIDMSFFNVNVLPELKKGRLHIKNGGMSHRIKAGAFKKVYVTSDIHSDFRKFVELLVNAGIITIPGDINLYTDDIYNIDILTETTWNMKNVCLIVLGDILDGKRGQGFEVDDKKGWFELFIHLFLYNMRIKAIDNSSFILFTFGNHDFHSLIRLDDHMLKSYVTISTKMFFNTFGGSWIENRKNVLLPFYEVIPLFYVVINDGTRTEMLGIHGGFHLSDGSVISAELNALQSAVNAIPASKSLLSLSPKLYDVLAMPGTDDGGLWSRVYENAASACSLLDGAKPNLFVVGHCPTTFGKAGSVQLATMNANPDLYAGCNKGDGVGRGCVTLSCSNKLAHVDVGMSCAFYGYADKKMHQGRDAEILILTHDPTLSTEKQYYNIMQRFSKTGGTIEMFRAEAAAENVVGGARKHKSRRRTHRRKRVSRRNRRI